MAATSPAFTVRFRPLMISVPSSAMRAWRFRISSMSVFLSIGRFKGRLSFPVAPLALFNFVILGLVPRIYCRFSYSPTIAGSSGAVSRRFRSRKSGRKDRAMSGLAFDQLDLPVPQIALQRLLSSDREDDVRMLLEPHQKLRIVSGRKTFLTSFRCSKCALQIAGHPGVNHATWLVRHHINEAGHRASASPLVDPRDKPEDDDLKGLIAPLHQPTDPSSEMLISFCASTANSIGSCWMTSRTKPLTIRAIASSSGMPRCMA